MAPSVNAGEGEVYVPGRSADLARELIAKAKASGVDASLVRTTSHGYIVPAEIMESEATLEDVDAPADTDSSASNVTANKGETWDEVVEDESEDEGEKEEELFDPADHKVDEVLAYLDSASEEERDRVLKSEQQGKKRASVLPNNTEGA